MKSIKLVVELGSSNTVIYKMGNGIVLREPSIVAVREDDNEIIAVGIKAKKLIGKTLSNIKIFSPIKNGVVENEHMCKEMFKRFLNKLIDDFVPKNIDVLFCVQNGLTDSELLILKNVAYACNVHSVDFINVCKAGAICAGFSKDNPKATISLNVGGGTVNMAIISRGDVLDGYSIGFGGINMDYAVQEYVKNIYNLEISLLSAEKLKIDCGSLYRNDTTNVEVKGIDFTSKRPQTEIVMAIDVLNAVEHYFDNIVKSVEQLICLCSPDVIADVSTTGIVVSGAVSNIVGFEDYFSKKLNLKVTVIDQPENAVVLGGAIYLGQQ